MSTLNIMIAEILETKEISKRSMVELKSYTYDDDCNYESAIEFEALAHVLAEAMTAKGRRTHLKLYNEGMYEYGDEDFVGFSEEDVDLKGHEPLDILKMKNVALSSSEKKSLIMKLSYDEKRYLGNWMLDNELTIQVVDDYEELDGELTFDTKTSYMDGVEIFHNNKY
jgi:hypothetical protein